MSKGTLNELKIGGGLNPTPPDERDFNLGQLVTFPSLAEIPRSFIVADVRIKDQTDNDFCTAYAGTYASGIQEGVDLSPEWQFMQTKFLAGEWQSFGADLRQAMQSLVKRGSRMVAEIPMPFQWGGGASRDFIANWENWPYWLQAANLVLAKGSFAKITGPYDQFDNIRAALWMSRKRFEQTGNSSDLKLAITGAQWKYAWTASPEGVLSTQPFTGGYGHAFVLNGATEINGVQYLVAPLSSGLGVGDNGKFYIPREVANRDLEWGAYTLIDQSPEVVKKLLERGWTTKYSWLAYLIVQLQNVVSKLKLN